MTDPKLLREARDALADMDKGIYGHTDRVRDTQRKIRALLTRLDAELAKVVEPVTPMVLNLSLDSDAVDIARGYLGDSDADSLLDELTELFSTRKPVVLDLSGVVSLRLGSWITKADLLAAIRAPVPASVDLSALPRWILDYDDRKMYTPGVGGHDPDDFILVSDLEKLIGQGGWRPVVVEQFADNGSHSHWQLVDPRDGTVLIEDLLEGSTDKETGDLLPDPRKLIDNGPELTAGNIVEWKAELSRIAEPYFGKNFGDTVNDSDWLESSEGDTPKEELMEQIRCGS